jgi:hypothetical protein
MGKKGVFNGFFTLNFVKMCIAEVQKRFCLLFGWIFTCFLVNGVVFGGFPCFLCFFPFYRVFCMFFDLLEAQILAYLLFGGVFPSYFG